MITAHLGFEHKFVKSKCECILAKALYVDQFLYSLKESLLK